MIAIDRAYTNVKFCALKREKILKFDEVTLGQKSAYQKIPFAESADDVILTIPIDRAYINVKFCLLTREKRLKTAKVTSC